MPMSYTSNTADRQPEVRILVWRCNYSRSCAPTRSSICGQRRCHTCVSASNVWGATPARFSRFGQFQSGAGTQCRLPSAVGRTLRPRSLRMSLVGPIIITCSPSYAQLNPTGDGSSSRETGGQRIGVPMVPIESRFWRLRPVNFRT